MARLNDQFFLPIVPSQFVTGLVLMGKMGPVPELAVAKVRVEYRKAYLDRKLNEEVHRLDFESTLCLPVCTKPMRSLRRVRIRDLETFESAEGKYVLVRIIEPPTMHIGVKMLVEDQFGGLVCVLLYNCVDFKSKLPVEEELPVGSVYIIKEPILKRTESDEIAIRCDSPSDFIRVDRNHDLYEDVSNIKWKSKIEDKYISKTLCKTTAEWKAEGNRLFGEGKYRDALEAYLVALKLNKDPSLNVPLHLNASVSCLNLNRFEECLSYTSLVLKWDKVNAKALYRAGKAHYELRQFREALEMFVRLVDVKPKDVNAQNEQKRCEERIREQEGWVDVYKLHVASTMAPKIPLDFGEYIGPVRVAQIEGKGRGMIATKDIEPGTILLASKAFHTSLETHNSGVAPTIFYGKTIDEVKLLADTCQAVMKNPNTFGKEVYSLPTNDPEYDQGLKTFCDQVNGTEPICDTERLRKIFRRNCSVIHGSILAYCEISPSTSEEEEEEDGCAFALFILASYFNHSCVSNTFFLNYNDVVIIRSSKPIRKGDEVTLAKQGNIVDFSTREKVHSEMNISCKCVLCELDQCEPWFLHQKRRYLYKLLAELSLRYPPFERMNPEFRRCMRRIIYELENSYGTRLILRGLLFEPYLRLAEALDYKTNMFEVTELVDKALHCVGLSSELLHRWAIDEEQLPKDSLALLNLIHVACSIVIRRCIVKENMALAKPWARVLKKLKFLICESYLPSMMARCKAVPFVQRLTDEVG